MRPKLLLLIHRIPFPPNKGDKVRSFHLLKHLATRHDVLLGTFVDDPDDWCYRDELSRYCSDFHVARLDPRWARLRSLTGLWRGEALTLPYYRDAGLAAWVDGVLRSTGVSRALVFSSAMAQYVTGRPGIETVVDFVDVDSDKWRQYGEQRGWPWSAIYRREGQRLLAFERRIAGEARESFFVTDAEAELFRRLAPEVADRVSHFCNGVDTDYFRPDAALASPYDENEQALVFTGAMDYWPNADAAVWFADEVFPAIRRERPAVRFYVVGMNPAPAVQALAGRPGIVVTGKVRDVRPYLQHARVAVAPLRVARGIQNKVLEAMAMAKPVVASITCAAPLSAVAGQHLAVADSAEAFAAAAVGLLDGSGAETMGRAARQRVVDEYNWDANLRRVDEALDRCARPNASPVARGAAGGAEVSRVWVNT